MKKILIAIISLSTLTACRLDLSPESSLTYNSFWESQEAVDAAHKGVYSSFRAYNQTLWALGEVRSDVWGGATTESAYSLQLIENSFTEATAPYGNWASMYGLLHYINDFIKSAPRVAASNQTQRDHMMGQMHGLRAYIYFTLLKTWGEVPLNDEPLTGVVDVNTLDKPRSSKAEVAEFIKKDIQKSLDYFNGNNTLWNGSSVYWSRPATLALKGEAYLFFGNVLAEGNAAFTEAKNALSQVSGFSLTPTYAGLWGTQNENNKEFIFAIDYAINQAGHFYVGEFTGQNAQMARFYDKNGNSMANWNFGGLNRYAVSDKVLDTFAAEPNDTRGDATVTLLYVDSNNGNGYPVYTKEKLGARMLKKFPGEIIDSKRQAYENIPIYRYADVLLLLAEAKNHLGEDPSTEINQIRARAYGSNTYPVYTNAGKEANTKAILDERFKEFIGEGKRWSDLQRAGSRWVFQEVDKARQNLANDERKIYLPITRGMIDSDPNLKQTEGW